MSSERKMWVKVSRPAHGKFLSVTVTLQEGSESAKWAVQAFSSTIKKGVIEAKAGAENALVEIQEALREIGG